jgi:hypothetical protein
MKQALLGFVLLLPIFARPLQTSTHAGTFPGRATVEYTFGQRMRFVLEGEGLPAISEAILYYTMPGMETPYRVRRTPEASDGLRVIYERDLRREPLPPFVPITFWWEVREDPGGWRSTEPQTFRYLDNRVAWQTLSAGPLRLHWHAGDPGLARSVLELARRSLERIGGPLGYSAPEPIDLFWYADPELARAAFRLAGLEIEGEVRPRWRAVILMASPDGAGLEALRRAIPHELTHVVLHDLAGGQPLPAWLDEGWAVWSEGPPDPALLRALQEPRLEGVSLIGLCGDFPTDPLRARQAYALAGATVRYLHDREGIGGLRGLLEAYAQGLSCESGVRRVLGRSLERLEREVEAALRPQPPGRAVLEGLGPWLLLFLLMSLGPFSLLLGGRSSSAR